MCPAELDDLRETRRLRQKDGMSLGKYLAISLEHALAWGRLFRQQGWETHQCVVRFTVPEEDASHFTLISENLDGIGPGFYAELEHLVRATIDTDHVYEA